MYKMVNVSRQDSKDVMLYNPTIKAVSVSTESGENLENVLTDIFSTLKGLGDLISDGVLIDLPVEIKADNIRTDDSHNFVTKDQIKAWDEKIGKGDLLRISGGEF